MHVIIKAEGISYSYGDFLAVDKITFSVDKGEILGFLGPNGAGKSTTVKMLTGQLRPSAGTISVLGHNLPEGRQYVHKRIGVCFEEKNLYPRLTVRENLMFFSNLFEADADVDELIDMIDLSKWADKYAESLSKGMQQRVMIARAIINDPEVLFLDEPTSGLDPISAKRIRDLIMEQKNMGKTIFLTTHNMTEADVLSDKVAFINEGKIVALDTPENLKLKMGERTLKIRYRKNGSYGESTLPLEGPTTPADAERLLSTEDIVTVHTQEATLEEVFLQLTGRNL